MDELVIRLRCVSCRAYRPFDRDPDRPTVVRCAACGRRHSTDSLHAVAPDERPDFEG